MKFAKQILALGFVFTLHPAAGIAQRVPATPPPRIGIDTSFGDRAQEAVAAFRLKHYKEAIAKANVALAMRPDDKNAAILYALRGNAFWRLKDGEHALADYNEAIRRDPAVRGIRGKRGLLHYYNGDYAAAIVDLTAGLRETRDPGHLYRSRALAFLKQGKHELARSDFEKVIKAPAIRAQGYFDRGDSYLKLGDAVQAARDFAKARRMASSDEFVLNSIAWLESTCAQAEFRNGKAAVRDATRACEISEWKVADIIDTLAAAYAEQGDFSRALTYERQAIDLEASTASRKVLQQHLTLFENNKPIREDLTIK